MESSGGDSNPIDWDDLAKEVASDSEAPDDEELALHIAIERSRLDTRESSSSAPFDPALWPVVLRSTIGLAPACPLPFPYGASSTRAALDVRAYAHQEDSDAGVGGESNPPRAPAGHAKGCRGLPF